MSGRYLARKSAQAILTIIAIVLLNFLLFRMMPGSPERVLLRNPYLTQEKIDQVRAEWGLDKPLIPDQLAELPRPRRVQGDLGYSFNFRGQSGRRGHRQRLLADDHPHRPRRGHRDHRRPGRRLVRRLETRQCRPTASAAASASILYSMPYFVIGMPLIIIFAANLGLVPDVGDAHRRRAVRLVPRAARRLPAAPRPAAAHGLARADRRLLDHHALGDHRDALRGLRHDRASQGPEGRPGPPRRTPSRTPCCRWSRSSPSTSATSSPGAITAEVVFNWPGLGTLTVDALAARDYPVLQGIFLLLSVTVVIGNLARRHRLRPARSAGARVSAAHRRPPWLGASAPSAGGCACGTCARSRGASSAGADGVVGFIILVDLHGHGHRPAAVRRPAPDGDRRDRHGPRAAVGRRTSSGPTSSAATS